MPTEILIYTKYYIRNSRTCVFLLFVVAWFSIGKSGDRVTDAFIGEIYEQKKVCFVMYLTFLTLDGMKNEEKTVEAKDN